MKEIEIDSEKRNAYWAVQLAAHVDYLKKHSPFYKDLKGEVSKVDDITQFPFTSKDDLAERNEDFLAIPQVEIRDYSATSGTLGDPVSYYLSEKDLQRLAQNEKGSLEIAGCTSKDVFQLMTTIDKQFMAGLAYQMGVRALGSGMVRTGPGVPYMQWRSILKYKPTVLIAVPSFIPYLLDYAEKNGIDANTTSVKKIVAIGEALTNADLENGALMNRIKDRWNVELISTYASTEMATAFTACAENSGLHVQPELIIVEVIGEDGKQVSHGEIGEVVVTPLGVEGTPLLRYRTGDICKYYDTPCSCGRTTPRLGPVLGRKQQMIKVKGTTIYPNMIVEALNAIEELKQYIIEISTNEWGGDELSIRCEASNAEVPRLITERLRSGLRVTPNIIVEDAKVLRELRFSENHRKPILVRDLRG
ncbi:phenylacetate--CoA ligase family protein [Owenweeksia hongkongensis]|uniref:phenylacetate--CoA ligase family protein n=1 Tax=Owenweeksia hongkongensis TaxID=253245 RepID=UPI003A8F19FA